VNDGNKIEILDGRHPVVERMLQAGEQFIPNDCLLDNDTQQILIITGPNMSGKSTWLRQVGLIVLLAQIGSFVSAKKAVIGLVDKIFTRVGASDNIAAGESTFLVEMHEAANIVNNATPNSLILLDEIGRGTSTFDGISIAWALTEYLHECPTVAAKTLFATHYHELNELAEIFPHIKNYKVEVKEWEDKVIFLRKVTPGFADHSYGIQVAQMAGLPAEITQRAKEILQNLEETELTPHESRSQKRAASDEVEVPADSELSSGNGKGLEKSTQQTAQGSELQPILPQSEMEKMPSSLRAAPRVRHARGRLFERSQITLFEMKDEELREELRNMDINALTPLEALMKLAELKKMVE
jgi:DNA mismatch repair protein MutS